MNNQTSVMVIDVETTGLSRQNDVITTACWYYEGSWHRWVRDLDSTSLLKQHWSSCSELITFNGRNFDERFLVKDIGVQPHSSHRDVMHDGWRHGYKGGLKKVALAIGLPRPPEIEGMDGRIAIYLWNQWKKGDEEALDLLSLYNAWDVWLTYGLYMKFVHQVELDPSHNIPWTLNPVAVERLLGSLPVEFTS